MNICYLTSYTATIEYEEGDDETIDVVDTYHLGAEDMREASAMVMILIETRYKKRAARVTQIVEKHGTTIVQDHLTP